MAPRPGAPPGTAGAKRKDGTAEMQHGDHQTIPSLDGFRALSVAIVLSGHAGVSRLIPGGFGVTVFFFLSGYLITTLFLRESRRYGTVSLRAFYIRRLLRLSPPLFVTLAIVYALVAIGQLPGEIAPLPMVSQALYFYNYYVAFSPDPTQGADGFHVLWSLAVEEHFYLIFPFVYLGYLHGRIRIPHLLAALLAFALWRVFNWFVLHVPAEIIYIRSDTRFDSILWGALLALLTGSGQAARLFPDRPAARWTILAGAAAVLVFCFVWRDAAFRETWRYTLQGAALMPVFHYAVTRPDLPPFRPLNWRPVMVIGAWSYSIYLIHYVILKGLAFHGFRLSPVVAFLVAGTLAAAYAGLLSRFVEDPVRAIRRRITGHEHRPAVRPAE